MPIKSVRLAVRTCTWLICFLVYTDYMAVAQPAEFRRLKRELDQSHTDSERANLYNDLGQFYTSVKTDSAIYFLRKAIDLAIKLPDKRLLVMAYYNLGAAHEPSGNYIQGLAALRQAERMNQNNSVDSIKTNIQVRIVRALRGLGNYQDALKLALALKQFYEKYPQRQNKLTGTLLTELSIIYERLGRSDSTLVYLLKADELAQRRRSEKEMAAALSNLSHYYTTIKDFERAEHYQKQALSLHLKIGYVLGVCVGFMQLAQIKQTQHAYTQAIINYKKALLVLQRIDCQEYLGNCYMGLAQCYLSLKDYLKASAYISRSTLIFQAIQSSYYLQQALETQAAVFEQSGEYKQALRFVRKAQVLKDRLIGLEKMNAISQLQTSYNLERKQTEIATLNKNIAFEKQTKQTIQLKLALAQYQRVFFLIISVLLMFLSGSIYLSLRRQKKIHRLLTQQTDKISLQARQLAELNTTKDKLFSLVSHDLRSPTARLKQDLYRLQTTSQLNPSLLEPLRQLEDQVNQILDLLTNLLDWSHSQLKGFQLNRQQIHLSDLVTDSLNQSAQHLRYKEITVLNQLSWETTVIADKHQLTSVIRNVLSNATKFTPKGGYIRLYTKEQSNYLELRIEDTGIGMKTEQVDRLFTSPEIRSGTFGESSTGLGLRLCQELLINQSGSLHVQSWPEKGTTVSIRLPKPSNVN